MRKNSENIFRKYLIISWTSFFFLYNIQRFQRKCWITLAPHLSITTVVVIWRKEGYRLSVNSPTICRKSIDIKCKSNPITLWSSAVVREFNPLHQILETLARKMEEEEEVTPKMEEDCALEELYKRMDLLLAISGGDKRQINQLTL